jgi:hypothetical protein
VALVEQLDGDRYGVVRYRDQRIEVGELHALREGQAIHGEVVRLHPREDRLYNVEVVVPAPARSGPPRVTTKAYRERWDAVFPRRSAPS